MKSKRVKDEDKSCSACVHAKEIKKTKDDIDLTYCLKQNKWITYREFCNEHWKINCYNCLHNKSVKFKGKRIVKDDDGGIHFRHLYDWIVDCEKEGIINLVIEGTRKFSVIPTCSLWRKKI